MDRALTDLAEQEFTVAEALAGLRLDMFLAQVTGVSRREASRLLEEGGVRVDRRVAVGGLRLSAGQVVLLSRRLQSGVGSGPVPQPDLPLEVLYEDDDLVAVNKPVGVHCHPLRAGEPGTVASAVAGRHPECVAAGAHPREGGVCHRLDEYTSGVLVFARHREAWNAIHRAFLTGQHRKGYQALCWGVPQAATGQIDWRLTSVPGDASKMQIATYAQEGLAATTHFSVLSSGTDNSLLSVWMETGRRHQIRVHLQSIGLPLVGDTLYEGDQIPAGVLVNVPQALQKDCTGPWLHASSIILHYQIANVQKSVEIHADLPAGRRMLLHAMKLV